jgi:hypothetical protein
MAEVEREDALDVTRVLHVPRVVDVELLLEIALDRLGHRALRRPERVPPDLAHHRERQEDHEEDDGDRPEEPSDDQLGHRSTASLSSRRAFQK